ncbi:uncharacterized protein SPPG_09528 [Spizellomyces punctatus DAOM BR117]|uniref:RRM domain-containing protein n=1 Tax=Spizellomyces punctatus (strain DAOM BR117) TaxID=645134 RepID=A0A0L0H613_SPIPD|nr:uncharacterized protein SPPG_09528 [Spizellomyces punctatus DAOM BR117]KNC96356.1 hypothetical protein SPPG_09528 [Spizellomyces punctatus DAOM BR117]|eukprot:XP_016604396.1 hypothetical protein SPPG_09528 [Spizellomyces punctatus DAOM BR117]
MSSRERRTTLFVRGFGPNVRARDLAYEFERFGRLVRCDIPAPKSARSLPFAFVEFEDYRDADDAYNSMHGKMIDGDRIDVEFARNRPLTTWRYEGRARSRSRSPPRKRSRTPPRRRSRTPPKRKRSPSPRRRSPLRNYKERSPPRTRHGSPRHQSSSPPNWADSSAWSDKATKDEDNNLAGGWGSPGGEHPRTPPPESGGW